MKNPNPDHNAILQALLDAQAAGLGTMTINAAIAQLQADKKLRADLQARWNGHAYPNKAMRWTRFTVSDVWQALSPEACKVGLLLGMYAGQSTLVQCSLPNVVKLTGLNRTAANMALRELRSAGVIAKFRQERQRVAPIYAVNPAICKKGLVTQQGEAAYNHLLPPEAKMPVPEYTANIKTIRTSDDGGTEYYTYTQITALSPEEADAEVAAAQAQPDPAADTYPEFEYQEPDLGDLQLPERNEGAVAGPATTPPELKTKHTTTRDDNTIPGQMSIADYPGVIED